jgi:hypothetical protein
VLTKNFTINIGAAYIHHSNGHTQLPNLGLNSFLAGISSTLFLSPLQDIHLEAYERPGPKRTKQYFVEFRNGLGVHEIGGPDSPLEKLKKSVWSTSLGGGAIFKRLIKVKIGLIYRFYHHYFNYIQTYQPVEYSKNPVVNSSSLIIYGGCELLLGHVGLDTEIGINLYKPFYKTHSRYFEDDSKTSYTFKRIFASRLGIRCYAWSKNKNPKHNIFIGAYINANFGQADFSEFSLGFVHRFRKIYHRK